MRLAALPSRRRAVAGEIVFGNTMPWYLASPPGVWSLTCAFSASDADTVAWGSGTLLLVNGTTYSISSGNTGNMAARTYIYFDPAASSTVLQTTTTAANAVGPGKVLLGVAEQSSTGPQAFFQIFGGGGGILSRTGELAPDAATETYYASAGADTISGGSVVTVLTVSFTPPVDCDVEISAVAVSDNVDFDTGNAWRINKVIGGSGTVLANTGNTDSNVYTFAIDYVLAVTAGVAVDINLQFVRTGGTTNVQSTSLLATLIKR